MITCPFRVPNGMAIHFSTREKRKRKQGCLRRNGPSIMPISIQWACILLQGRYFSKEIASDSEATVINEAMAAKLGLKDPIGKQIENGWQKFTVIGVVEDFNFESMKQSVNPLCLVLANYNSSIYRRSYRILGNVEMAAGFRLPHFHKLVDDRYCRFCRRNNCPVYNMFSFN